MRRYPGDMWHYARNRMIVAARANGHRRHRRPVRRLRQPGRLPRAAAWAATLGAVGKWCIHPSQVAIANEVFAPTADEITQAARIIAGRA